MFNMNQNTYYPSGGLRLYPSIKDVTHSILHKKLLQNCTQIHKTHQQINFNFCILSIQKIVSQHTYQDIIPHT